MSLLLTEASGSLDVGHLTRKKSVLLLNKHNILIECKNDLDHKYSMSLLCTGDKHSHENHIIGLFVSLYSPVV